jgi:hypothetical protein
MRDPFLLISNPDGLESIPPGRSSKSYSFFDSLLINLDLICGLIMAVCAAPKALPHGVCGWGSEGEISAAVRLGPSLASSRYPPCRCPLSDSPGCPHFLAYLEAMIVDSMWPPPRASASPLAADRARRTRSGGFCWLPPCPLPVWYLLLPSPSSLSLPCVGGD